MNLVSQLDLPVFDYTAPRFAADRYHEQLAEFRQVTPFTARICVEDVTYRDVAFPAGAIVAICARTGPRRAAGARPRRRHLRHREAPGQVGLTHRILVS
jgi:hypothetical protein